MKEIRQRRRRELKIEHQNRKPIFLLTKEEVVKWWNGISQSFTGKSIEELRKEYNS